MPRWLKKRSRTSVFHCSLLTLWRKTLDAVYKWTDGLLMSLPTRCMPVLMLDLNDRMGRPRAEEPHDLIGTVGAGVEGDSASRFQSPCTSTLNCSATNVSSGSTHILRFEWTITDRFCCHTPFCAILAYFCQFHSATKESR